MHFPSVVLLLLAICFTAAGEPKAYDLVKYKGTAGGLAIAFDYADGYSQASEVRITDTRRKKTTRFVLDDSGEMHFVPEKDKDVKAKLLLKMQMDDAAPTKVEGTYTADGKTIPFTLTTR